MFSDAERCVPIVVTQLDTGQDALIADVQERQGLLVELAKVIQSSKEGLANTMIRILEACDESKKMVNEYLALGTNQAERSQKDEKFAQIRGLISVNKKVLTDLNTLTAQDSLFTEAGVKDVLHVSDNIIKEASRHDYFATKVLFQVQQNIPVDVGTSCVTLNDFRRGGLKPTERWFDGLGSKAQFKATETKAMKTLLQVSPRVIQTAVDELKVIHQLITTLDDTYAEFGV